MDRALIEVTKFLNVSEVLLQFQLVSTHWKKVALKEEVLFHLLPDHNSNSLSLPLYQRVKEECSQPRYLLNIADEHASVWDLWTDFTRMYPSALFIKSSRYVLCSASTAIVTGGIDHYKSCVKINVQTGVIEPLPDLLQDRAWHGITILNNEVYVSGGYIEKQYIVTAEKYSQGRWVELPPMQQPRSNHTLSAFQSQVYAFGGSNGRFYLDSIEAFDGKRWTLLEVRLPQLLNYPIIIIKKNVIILIGRYEHRTTERKVYSLSLNSTVWTEICSIKVDSISNAVALKAGKLFFYTHSEERVSLFLQAQFA